MSRVTVIGAGYVGLVTAACLAHLGHEVTGMDIDGERVRRLNQGEIPIYEPGLVEIMAGSRSRLSFTDDPVAAYQNGRFIFICVDTPPTYSGDADLSRIWQVVANLPPRTANGCSSPSRPCQWAREQRFKRSSTSAATGTSRTARTRSSCGRGRPFRTSCTLIG
ncbi:MAG: hypothetical protein M5U22_15975 [Thermoleophilia bacterium]|nr:hypothetical protein [Thermoleophilia bacterium]